MLFPLCYATQGLTGNLEISFDNVSFSMTSFKSPIVVWDCQTKHDSLARNYPISTVLNVECFLKVILSIYCFKMMKFPFENSQYNMLTMWHHNLSSLMNKSNDALTSHR